MRSLLYELLGSFFVAFVACLCLTSPGPGPMAPFAVAAAFSAVILAGGNSPVAHLNPALTLATALRGAGRWRDVFPYWVFQLWGALLGGAAARALKGAAERPMAPEFGPALLAELVFVFALCLAFLRVASSPSSSRRLHWALAGGFLTLAGMFSAGALSGGVMNFALAAAFCETRLLAWPSLAIWFLASLAGASSAALVARALESRKG